MTERGVRRAPASLAGFALFSITALAVLALAGCSAGAGSGSNISVAIGNKVSSVQAGAAAIIFSATVQHDSHNSGVTWSLKANGANCAPTCGALSAATSTSVTYTPPASAGASPNNQPTLTATSAANTSKSDSDTFTISPAALIVTITNKVSTVNAGNVPFVLNATVQNDSTNSGVSWTLKTNGGACTAACGTLTGDTATSVTYAPPATVPAAPNITLTATSVHDTSKSDADSFTISQAAISVSIADKVSSVPANSSIVFSANVYNDSANPGTTWALTANGTNCQPACGTLATLGQSSTGYIPPTSVPSSPNNRPTLTAISVSDNRRSDTDTFTITAAAAIKVTINRVSTVLAGTAGTNFDAMVQNDSSQSGVTWTLACSPLCGSLSGNTTTSVTYSPPLTVPASPNNQATIVATSIADNSKTASNTLTITSTVANGCTGASHGQESLLNGHYALLMQGFEGSGTGTPILMGASFAANGSGGVTGGEEGEEDVNDTVSAQHLTLTSSGSLYTVGSDHRGCLQLTNATGTTTVFHFVVGGINSGVASKGRIIEFDDNSGNGAGSRGAGILRLQTPSSFVLSALQAKYAFGLDGFTANGNSFVHQTAGGSFSNNNGALSNGVEDKNVDGFVSLHETGGSGQINTVSATTGRATANFEIFNWAVYVINPSELFLIGTDCLETTFISQTSGGRAIATGNSFTASALSGNYILHASGNSNSSASVNLDLLTTIAGGAQTGTLSGTVYSDGGGSSAATTTLSNVAYNVDPASGRVALGNSTDNLPVLYLTTPTDGISAFVVGVNADAQEGVIEFQPSQTYSTASVAGTFFFGTEDPGDNTVYNDAGSATVSSSGSASTTLDSSTTAGLTPNVPFNTTVTIANSNGTGNVGSQTVAITNGTKIFYIDETSNVIVVAEQ